MKKLIAILLSLTFVLSFSVVAIATTLDNTTSFTTKDVTAKYVAGTDGDTVYSIDIEWGAMSFTYNQGSNGTWDPSTHKYTNSIEPGWSPTSETANVVTVTNHSNSNIKCNISFSTEEKFSFVTGTLSNPSISLPTAENKDKDDTSLTQTSTLTLSGTPKSSFDDMFVIIGTLKIELQT